MQRVMDEVKRLNPYLAPSEPLLSLDTINPISSPQTVPLQNMQGHQRLTAADQIPSILGPFVPSIASVSHRLEGSSTATHPVPP